MQNIKLVEPNFNSDLMDLIIELDYLRKKTLVGTTPPEIFFQLKHLFHILESIGSARIEGNNTTVAEYIETKLDVSINNNLIDTPPSIIEISNIEKAMQYIEEYDWQELSINRKFISELHQLIVHDLLPPPHGEGDSTPGEYRNKNVKIHKASHIPPDMIQVPEYMDDFFKFINNNDKPKYDLLKVAIAHHKFVWIHPFNNGNGRTVRLLTYAMMIKAGFNVKAGRILNPTAVFCSSRDDYYNYLAMADNEGESGLLQWCEYVLKGLKIEIEKIDRLLDYKYLSHEILLPAIVFCLDRKYITDDEFAIFKLLIHKHSIRASDIKELLHHKNAQATTRQINKLLDKKMIAPEDVGKRKYIMKFDNNYLIRGIMQALDKKGFLPLQ